MDTLGGSPPPSSPRSHTRGRNSATRHFGSNEVLGVDFQRLVTGFEWGRQGALLSPTSVTLGYRVFWTRPPHTGFLDLPAIPGAYAILGRHDHCDAVLEGDDRLSLRHLLLTSYPLDGGGVALRMVDLLTQLPMFLDDETPRHSLVVTGAARVRLGSWIVGALPITGGNVEGAAVVAAANASVDVHELVTPPRITLSTRISSGVASLPPVTHSMILSYRHSAAGLPPPPGMAQLSLRRGGRSVTVEVRDDDLERGILLGRADRCLDAGLRSVLSASISRTHLLLLRDRDRTFAFDVASTNGTYQNGKRVRRASLDDDGATLWLGPREGVELTYRRGPTLH